mgnify:CR=1 FL=1
MCLDEIKFFTDIETKYIVVITDFETGNIVDIIESRRYEIMQEYFSRRSNDLKNVQFILSDMYDGFCRIHQHYFSHAVHAIDLFHTIEDLTRSVNTIRTRVMKEEYSHVGEKEFMKQHWRLFLMNKQNVTQKTWDKTYHNKRTNEEKDYFQWLQSCLNLDRTFSRAYQCLQEMYKYSSYSTYEEGLRHIERIIQLLEAEADENLLRVAKTYQQFKYEIVNCLDKKSRNFRYTTGIAECINNHIKTLIKICYGCLNFKRFRNRILLISRYNKIKRNIK